MSAATAMSTDEREELRAAARKLLERESPSTRVRAVVAQEPGFDRALWDEMVRLGWTGVHVPTELGGSGAGYADLAVLLHELGRSIVPSPFLASAVLSIAAFVHSDNRDLAGELVPSLVSGDHVGSVALASARGSYDVSGLTATWEHSDGGMRLRGVGGFVLDADVADVLVVAAADASGTIALVAVDTGAAGMHVERTATVDPTRRLFEVTFDDVVVTEDRMLCDPGARAEELFEQLLAVGAVGAACDAAGAADRVLERTATYAKERIQFGRPIGSFQAVKHHCANMAISVEASRAAVRAAAASLDGDPEGWPTAAVVASSYVGPACTEACGLALRVHGGIGFTWEHDSHLYLKRVKLDEVLFGTPSWHRRRLADDLIARVEDKRRSRA
jgi:alkylation response protein AidB-like acyl-CoA dehydrogenase